MRAGEFPERRARAARQDRHGARAISICAIRCSIASCTRAHPRTGTTWKIYPSYDFAHGQSDAIEGITHSICTLEFEDHRPLYDWFIDNLPVPSRPHQYEFARLNLTYTVLSKRVLTELVRDGHVTGWDDPRMPTLAGLAPARRAAGSDPRFRQAHRRRQGQQPGRRRHVRIFGARGAEQDARCGAWRCCKPLKVVIENYPEGQSRGTRSGQSSRRSGGGHAQDQIRPRALHRAGRLHGEPAEEILPAVARHRSAAALRLFHHLPRGGEKRRRRGGRTALHLRSGDQRRQRAGRPQGEGDHALGVGGGCVAGRSAALQSAVHASPIRPAARISPPISIRIRSKCLPTPGSSRRSPTPKPEGRCSSSARLFLPRSGLRRRASSVFNRTVGLRDTFGQGHGEGESRGLSRSR